MDADVALDPPVKLTAHGQCMDQHKTNQIERSVDDRPHQVFCKRELTPNGVLYNPALAAYLVSVCLISRPNNPFCKMLTFAFAARFSFE
jgi:hypothetical protein